MTARDIMTRDPACITPEDTAQQAALLMEQYDCGSIPVVQDNETRRLVGVVTDRDITLRAVGRGRGAETPVSDIMSKDVACCTADSDVDEVGRLMADRQVRRVPIIDGDGCCIGMVAQADLARNTGRAVSESEVAHVVEQISEPVAEPRGRS